MPSTFTHPQRLCAIYSVQDGTPYVRIFQAVSGERYLGEEQVTGSQKPSNAWRIYDAEPFGPDENFLGVNDVTLADPIFIGGGGEVCGFGRENIPPGTPFEGSTYFLGYGIGVPVRFTVEVVESLFTSGVFVSDTVVSTTLLTMAATALTSTTLTVPTNYTSGADSYQYNARLTRIELPWIAA